MEREALHTIPIGSRGPKTCARRFHLLDLTGRTGLVLKFDRGIRAFFPGKKAAKKPVGDAAFGRNNKQFAPVT